GRLQQVWFSGMHSDVGGGYPNDSLAYVSLDWMMREAAAAGLRFRRDAIDEIKRTLDPCGPMHDSRRGLAGYYRYQPRKIGARLDPPDPTTLIMQDPDPKMRALLKGVKVHESVLNRMQSGQDRYAPNVLPGNYHVAMANGSVAPAPESPADAQARSDGQQWVWNDTWRKRINYFVTVGVSLFLALLPVVNALFPPTACVGPQCLLTPVITGIGGVLPGFLQPWIEAFAARPGLFAVVAIAIALLLSRGAALQTRIQDSMRQWWHRSLRLPTTTVSTSVPPRQGLPDDWVYRLRTNRVYLSVFRSLKWQILPNAFGIGVLLAAVALVLALIFVVALRVQLAVAEGLNSFCGVGREPVTADSATIPDRFPTNSLCWPTGRQVVKGNRYRITLTVTTPWADADIPATPAGFGSELMPWYARYGGALLRRSLGDRWFQPLVKIVPPPGTGGGYVEALELQRDESAPGVYIAKFDALRTGDLFIFVNDAILPWTGADGKFYENNSGDAAVRIDAMN
ncbi:MAG: phospholipase effector Tle1 domain-containing protein, partial [Dongiaceae bacterium]